MKRTMGWSSAFRVLGPDNRDLATGVDRSDLIAEIAGRWERPVDTPHDGTIFALRSRDDRYTLIAGSTVPFEPWTFLPYYGLILLTIALLCWPLAWHINSPLRSLARTVDRFGQGDLSTRAKSKRRDEIGELARSFDRMADRLETLLTAERRLLQDVSHELRSPLARLSFAAALLNTEPDRRKAEARIQKEVGRLATLVGSLLEMTRAEGDPTSRQFKTIQIQDLLRDVVDDCSVEAAARSCSISIESSEPASITDEEVDPPLSKTFCVTRSRLSPGNRQPVIARPNSEGLARKLRRWRPGILARPVCTGRNLPTLRSCRRFTQQRDGAASALDRLSRWSRLASTPLDQRQRTLELCLSHHGSGVRKLLFDPRPGLAWFSPV